MDTTRTAKTTRPAATITAPATLTRPAAEISYGAPLRSDNTFCVYVDVVAPRSAGYRALRAAVLRLAAEIEERSGAADRWVVSPGHAISDTHGRVEIELATGLDAEAVRAVRVAAAAILGIAAKASV